MNATNVSAEANRLGRQAENSPLLEHAIRVGLVAYGTVHLLIAWIAVQLAFGSDQGSASSKGALQELAKAPLGDVLLFVVAGGFAALVVWQVVEALGGHRDKRGRKRVLKRLGSALKAIVYGGLGLSALEVAMGGHSGRGGDNTQPMTARIMAMPAGPLLVAAVGLVVVGVGCRLVYRGFSEDFREQLDVRGHTGGSGSAYVKLGKVGHVAKGLAFFVVGGLFLWAAWTHDPRKSGGLDQALHELLRQPFGAAIIVALGVGFACYGLYAYAWARHLDT